MLRHPYILGDLQQRGAKSEVVPNKREQNQKWLPHPVPGGTHLPERKLKQNPAPNLGHLTSRGPA